MISSLEGLTSILISIEHRFLLFISEPNSKKPLCETISIYQLPHELILFLTRAEKAHFPLINSNMICSLTTKVAL